MDGTRRLKAVAEWVAETRVLYHLGKLLVGEFGTVAFIRHLAQTAPNGAWGSWESLGAPHAQGGFFLHQNTRRCIALGCNADGRLEVFVPHWGNVDTQSPVVDFWHVWQTRPNGGWSHWRNMGAIPKRSPALPFDFETASMDTARARQGRRGVIYWSDRSADLESNSVACAASELRGAHLAGRARLGGGRP